MTSRQAGVAALAAVALLGACSGDDGSTPPATSPSTPAPTAADTPAPGGTESEPGLPFDCDAVAGAQQALNDAAEAELERLGIDRTSPEAFTVVLLVTSQNASEYWGQVAQAATAATPDLAADLDVVTAYWAELDGPLSEIQVADSSPAAVQAASDELAAISTTRPDESLAAAQQRIQDELSATCGTEPQSPSGTESS